MWRAQEGTSETNGVSERFEYCKRGKERVKEERTIKIAIDSRNTSYTDNVIAVERNVRAHSTHKHTHALTQAHSPNVMPDDSNYTEK